MDTVKQPSWNTRRIPDGTVPRESGEIRECRNRGTAARPIGTAVRRHPFGGRPLASARAGPAVDPTDLSWLFALARVRCVTSQFSVLLRQLRRQTALTQEVLAERTGLSVRTIRRLETGESANPQMDTVRLLADALRLEPDERAQMLAVADGQAPQAVPVEGRQSAFERRLAEATDDLAHAVGARLGREEELRRIQDPFPLPVRWQRAPDDVMDQWENICRVSPGETAAPLPLAGRMPEIVDVHRRIPSGRLVVLGRAGSGKSVLAARFVLDLLRVRESGGAVPVVVGVGSWNPTTTEFRDWLASQLVRDHPGLGG
jgi:transcriptional regulator with XRE-family HTH domain